MDEGFIPKIVLIVIVVILAVGGAGAYFVLENKEIVSGSYTIGDEKIAFRSIIDELSFDYPMDWEVRPIAVLGSRGYWEIEHNFVNEKREPLARIWIMSDYHSSSKIVEKWDVDIRSMMKDIFSDNEGTLRIEALSGEKKGRKHAALFFIFIPYKNLESKGVQLLLNEFDTIVKSAHYAFLPSLYEIEESFYLSSPESLSWLDPKCGELVPGHLNISFNDSVSPDDVVIFINEILVDKYGYNEKNFPDIRGPLTSEWYFYQSRPYYYTITIPLLSPSTTWSVSTDKSSWAMLMRLADDLANDNRVKNVWHHEDRGPWQNNDYVWGAENRIFAIEFQGKDVPSGFLNDYPDLAPFPPQTKIGGNSALNGVLLNPNVNLFMHSSLWKDFELMVQLRNKIKLYNSKDDIHFSYLDATGFSVALPNSYSSDDIREVMREIYGNEFVSKLIYLRSKIHLDLNIEEGKEKFMINELLSNYGDRIAGVEQDQFFCQNPWTE